LTIRLNPVVQRYGSSRKKLISGCNSQIFRSLVVFEQRSILRAAEVVRPDHILGIDVGGVIDPFLVGLWLPV